MASLQAIGVIGAGTMGTGITQVRALSGLSVSMLDVDEQRAARGQDAVAGGLERLVKKATLSAAERDAALGRLRGTMAAAGDLGRKSGCGFYTYN
jgi:3-hydroxybutyryl-CoA dehydrogenase